MGADSVQTEALSRAQRASEQGVLGWLTKDTAGA